MISLVEKHPWLWLLGTTILGNPHIHVLDIDPKGVDSFFANFVGRLLVVLAVGIEHNFCVKKMPKSCRNTSGSN